MQDPITIAKQDAYRFLSDHDIIPGIPVAIRKLEQPLTPEQAWSLAGRAPDVRLRF